MRAIVLCGLAGCFTYSEMPNNRADPHLRKITEAQILDMNINLYKQPGLCPGQEGKLYVNAKVQWPNAQPVPRSLGADVDSLQPEAFSIKGPLLRGDANAHLFPDPDVLKSVETGFEIDVVYRPQPRFHFHETFKPEYSCYTGWAQEGNGGEGGGGGYSGSNGGAGQDGGHGENGGRGGRGGNGGRIVAYVTVVKTRFYDRLLAVIANDQFFLAPADRALTFDVVGGPGGSGGGGGQGGNGGEQQVTERQVTDPDTGSTSTVRYGKGRAGNGGNGGNGGPGGDGGNGGTIEITYDSAFPELRELLLVNVDGGPPGEGGGGGGGGNGGGTNADKEAQTGNTGNGGESAGSGRQGGRGSASVHGGSVNHMFGNLHGITVLGRR